MQKLIYFLLIGCAIAPLAYYVKSKTINSGMTPTVEDIFIWGDSQMYRGVDGNYLSRLTGQRVLNASRDGAGVYDFYVFSENVPQNSLVIAALSKTIFMRGPSRDRDMAGFSFDALYTLLDSGYKPWLLARIIAKNSNPDQLFELTNKLYPYNDSLVVHQPLSIFESFYSNKPDYFTSKFKVYEKALTLLKQKGCIVILVDFPFHPKLSDIQRTSPAYPLIRHVNYQSALRLEASIDTMTLESNDKIMYDLTHFNERSARLFTEQLSSEISKATGSKALIVQINEVNARP
ncbi:MAG: hypothetical protein AAF901_08170 [Bacteroidota bacterium]